MSSTSKCDIMPTEVLRIILQHATSSPRILDTSLETLHEAAQDQPPKLRHFGQDILNSMPTKLALSLVSKQFRNLTETWLFEAIIVTEYDRIPQLCELLRAPSISDPTKSKGTLCRRLDFLLGRRGHYWDGEAGRNALGTLLGLLPVCPNVEVLIVDPLRSGYDDRSQNFLALPPVFWTLLGTKCRHSLRMLTIGHVAVNPKHVPEALGACTQLQSFEILVGWYGALPEALEKRITLPNLHRLKVYNFETLHCVAFPNLRSAYISTNDSLFDIRRFQYKFDIQSLTHLEYRGFYVDIFQLATVFPSITHFTLVRAHFGHRRWEFDGDNVIPNLKKITVQHYYAWPTGQPILENIAQLCEAGALPALTEVEYVEHHGLVRSEPRDAVEMTKAFQRLNIGYTASKRWLSFE
ncbi:hypothetical protein FRC17_008131 [Serendipita sp. 399]|nr:hypothetical protein FRC17_008131 [Serendipita sp. 399]